MQKAVQLFILGKNGIAERSVAGWE